MHDDNNVAIFNNTETLLQLSSQKCRDIVDTSILATQFGMHGITMPRQCRSAIVHLASIAG